MERRGWFGRVAAGVAAAFGGGCAMVGPQKGGLSRRDLPYVDAREFGAKGDGVADDTAALQSFFDYVSGTNSGAAALIGDFAVSDSLILGPIAGEIATKELHCSARIVSTGIFDTALAMHNIWNCALTGSLSIVCNGGAVYSSRTINRAITVMTSGFSSIQKLQVSGPKIDGVLFDTVASAFHIDHLYASSCGSCPTAGQGITANWSNNVQVGSSGSLGQLSTIDVTALPPVGVSDKLVFVEIGGEPYRVNSIDRIGGKISVFPWIPTTISSGTLKYIFGAGLCTVGDNANVNTVNQLVVDASGIALLDGSLFGMTVNMLTAQVNGAGLVIGQDVQAAKRMTVINTMYTEANTFDIIKGTIAETDVTIHASTIVDSTKVVHTGVARLANNAFNIATNPFNGVSVTCYGRRYESLKGLAGQSGAVVNDTVYVGEYPNKTYYMNWSGTLTLDIDPDRYRISGDASMSITVFGFANNGQYPGTLTFDTVAGKTINGAASVAFSGFIGPAHFAIDYSTITQSFLVRAVGKPSAAVADVVAAPTQADFNALLASLRSAGILLP